MLIPLEADQVNQQHGLGGRDAKCGVVFEEDLRNRRPAFREGRCPAARDRALCQGVRLHHSDAELLWYGFRTRQHKEGCRSHQAFRVRYNYYTLQMPGLSRPARAFLVPVMLMLSGFFFSISWLIPYGCLTLPENLYPQVSNRYSTIELSKPSHVSCAEEAPIRGSFFCLCPVLPRSE